MPSCMYELYMAMIRNSVSVAVGVTIYTEIISSVETNDGDEGIC